MRTRWSPAWCWRTSSKEARPWYGFATSTAAPHAAHLPRWAREKRRSHPRTQRLLPLHVLGRARAHNRKRRRASAVKAAALQRVVSFSDFTPHNDPHKERDFGAFELADHRFFWKIDYYDARCEFGSEDPSDPTKTTRVLTLMLVQDY